MRPMRTWILSQVFGHLVALMLSLLINKLLKLALLAMLFAYLCPIKDVRFENDTLKQCLLEVEDHQRSNEDLKHRIKELEDHQRSNEDLKQLLKDLKQRLRSLQQQASSRSNMISKNPPMEHVTSVDTSSSTASVTSHSSPPGLNDSDSMPPHSDLNVPQSILKSTFPKLHPR